MKESPFSKKSVPLPTGIAAKIEMGKTAITIVDQKKDFIESSINSQKVRAMQLIEEEKNKLIQELREKGDSTISKLKQKKEELEAKKSSNTNSFKETASITSAKGISSAISKDSKLNSLKATQDKQNKLIESVSERVNMNEQNLEKLKRSGAPSSEIQLAKSKLTASEIELKHLQSSSEDTKNRINSRINSIITRG